MSSSSAAASPDLTTAYLARRGGTIGRVLERDRCAQIDTGHTTAHLTMVTDTSPERAVAQVRPHACAGGLGCRLAAIAQIDTDHSRARDRLRVRVGERLSARARRHGRSPTRPSTFREEASLAAELGFDATFVEDVPFIGGPGIRFDDQARFHPRKYLAGLARAIASSGGQIFEHSEAEEFRDEPRRREGERPLVHARRHRHRHAQSARRHRRAWRARRVFQTKLALYTSYVDRRPRAARARFPTRCSGTPRDPYHYLRLEPHRDHDLVIFGGEDHKTGQVSDTNACYRASRADAHGDAPDIELTHRWSGQVIETPDGLPYIGQMADHQYAATGFCGNGMTFGTLGGDHDRRTRSSGAPNPWAELFDPGRAAIRRGLWEYIKENADYPYYMMRDRFAGAEGKSLRAVKRGQGKVIEHEGAEGRRVSRAGRRADAGSATCTHMGCLVALERRRAHVGLPVTAPGSRRRAT